MGQNKRKGEVLADRYRLGESIALDDGTGEYYRAHDERLDRHVTIKCLEKGFTPRTLKRYGREARILGALEHPALMRVFDAVLEGFEPFLVMASVEATPLTEWAAVPLDVDKALAIARALGEALSLAHARGFLHRRVVPKHVLIAEDGSPRLIGFGRASLGGGRGSSTSDIQTGPSGYLSPELFLSDGRDPRTDVYGLGIVLFYLLTGRAPLPPEDMRNPAKSIRTLIQSKRVRLRDCRPDVSAALDAFMAKTLDLDVDVRPQSAVQWVRELDALASTVPPSPLEKPIRPGDRVVDRYVVEATIGRGTHGEVVLANDEELHRPVAIKFINGGADTLRLEARAMAQVTHPNVVQVYDVGASHGRDYLVMENVPGRSVEERLDDGGLTRNEAMSVIDQTARGLTAIHDVGLVHGDVKPSNILLGPAFRVCIADFGLVRKSATWADPHARLGGTPAYYAPERARGDIEEDWAFSIDLYALGVMAFELLTGRLPFKAKTPLALVHAHKNDAAPAVSSLSPELAHFDAVIERALRKAPAERFASVDAFRRALLDANQRGAEATSAPKVLVINNTEGDAEEHATSAVQTHLGAEVIRARSGEAALVRLEADSPDLILMEMELGDMNGIEFAGSVRANVDTPPPMVVVTAQGSSEDWQVLSALGVRAFLIKPVDPELLTLTLRRLLSAS